MVLKIVFSITVLVLVSDTASIPISEMFYFCSVLLLLNHLFVQLVDCSVIYI